MASRRGIIARLGRLLLRSGMLAVLPAGAVGADLLHDFLLEADAGQCIESVTYRVIREQGPQHADRVVQAALSALAQREQQQRTLGCEGDIAAQAIGAGADPDLVLKATAAGL